MKEERKGCWRGGGGGGGFLAHLLRLAAASTAPPRPPKVQSHLIRPNLQAGARSEVKSLQCQELGWGHPTPPKRHPTPAQTDREPPGSVHLHCVDAASLQLRERRGDVLSASCTKSHRSRSQGPKLTGLVGWGASGTAHLERSSDFAIAGPCRVFGGQASYARRA